MPRHGPRGLLSRAELGFNMFDRHSSSMPVLPPSIWSVQAIDCHTLPTITRAYINPVKGYSVPAFTCMTAAHTPIERNSASPSPIGTIACWHHRGLCASYRQSPSSQSRWR